MARGRAAAGYWMIHRQNQSEYDPFNPYNLPEYLIGNAALYHSVTASLAVSLFLTDSVIIDLSVPGVAIGAVVLSGNFIQGH